VGAITNEPNCQFTTTTFLWQIHVRFLVHVGAFFNLGAPCVLLVIDICALLATDFMWEPPMCSWLLIHVGVRPKVKLDRFHVYMLIDAPQKASGRVEDIFMFICFSGSNQPAVP
jgi:hypothetical protein